VDLRVLFLFTLTGPISFFPSLLSRGTDEWRPEAAVPFSFLQGALGIFLAHYSPYRPGPRGAPLRSALLAL